MINDFIEYWTAAMLLLRGSNPYSPEELLLAQRALGWQQAEPLMMWNPPWTLTFLLPFAALDYETAQFAWFLCHALIVFLGGLLLWRVYGGASAHRRDAVVAALTFAPVYFALLLGQIGPLVLLGLIGFLRGIKHGSWTAAGASLALAAIKPHLVYLVWLGLALWILREKNWRLACAFAGSGLAVAAAPLLFAGDVYAHYFRLLQGGGVTRPLEWATPAPGTALAQLFSIPGAWIRWLPAVLGALWFVRHWSRRSDTWDWIAETPLLVAVSVATTSFAWTFDHVVLLPALIHGAALLRARDANGAKAAIIGIHLALGALLIAMKIFVRNDFWYFWAAPSYLLLYLCARASTGTAARAAKA